MTEEQPGRLDPRVQLLSLIGVPWSQIPDRLEALALRRRGMVRRLGQHLPNHPTVRAPVDVDAPHRVMRGGVCGGSVPRIEDRMIDLVAGQAGPLQLPAPPLGVGPGEEEALAGPDQQEDLCRAGRGNLTPPQGASAALRRTGVCPQSLDSAALLQDYSRTWQALPGGRARRPIGGVNWR